MLLKKSLDSIITYRKIILSSALMYYNIFTMSNVMQVLLNPYICYEINKFSKIYKRPQCH